MSSTSNTVLKPKQNAPSSTGRAAVAAAQVDPVAELKDIQSNNGEQPTAPTAAGARPKQTPSDRFQNWSKKNFARPIKWRGLIHDPKDIVLDPELNQKASEGRRRFDYCYEYNLL